MLSVKENMLEGVEESRSFMKRMNRTGEITEPRGTPEVIEWGLERKPSILIVTDLPDRKLAIHVIRVGLRPNVGSLARSLYQTRSQYSD